MIIFVKNNLLTQFASKADLDDHGTKEFGKFAEGREPKDLREFKKFCLFFNDKTIDKNNDITMVITDNYCWFKNKKSLSFSDSMRWVSRYDIARKRKELKIGGKKCKLKSKPKKSKKKTSARQLKSKKKK